jgi:hypothetical protein
MTRKEWVSVRSPNVHTTDGVAQGYLIFSEIPVMGSEPLGEEPHHLVRREKVTLGLTTKVNDRPATIPVIPGSLDTAL